MSLPSKPPIPSFGWPGKWWQWLMDLLLWMTSRQPLPDANDFAISEDPNGVRFKLLPKAVERLAASNKWALKITDASTATTAKLNVALGDVSGRSADSAMTIDGKDITLTVTGVRYIYCEVTVGYTAPLWISSACALIESSNANPKASTATKMYVFIGRAERESNGAGGFRVKAGTIYNALRGSQGAIRTGNSSTYGDTNWVL